MNLATVCSVFASHGSMRFQFATSSLRGLLPQFSVAFWFREMGPRLFQGNRVVGVFFIPFKARIIKIGGSCSYMFIQRCLRQNHGTTRILKLKNQRLLFSLGFVLRWVCFENCLLDRMCSQNT